jgi:putative transcriptional regulator
MNEKDFELLVESIKQAGEIKRGERQPSRIFRFSPLDVKEIRRKLQQSQREFAQMIGVSLATLQNWEQGRRKPEGPARALLRVAMQNPQAVKEALAVEVDAAKSA